MRTKEKSFTLLTLALLAMALLMLSCRKDDEPEQPEDQPLGMIIAPDQVGDFSTINYTLIC